MAKKKAMKGRRDPHQDIGIFGFLVFPGGPMLLGFLGFLTVSSLYCGNTSQQTTDHRQQQQTDGHPN